MPSLSSLSRLVAGAAVATVLLLRSPLFAPTLDDPG
jgi:hypothetical protein